MIVDRLYKQTHAHIHTKKERNKKNATQAHAERERERDGWADGLTVGHSQSGFSETNPPHPHTDFYLLHM